tara:strand:+ start:4925 stop:7765 length:2841 start_codon:yes stop_codon:yes gene_type:complete
MPKKTFTLNGFAGGLNTDSDLSDVVSQGNGQDEVAELNNLFLDEGGKVHGKLPIGTANDLTVEAQTSGAENMLIHDSKIYNKVGVYKVGEDVNYSGLADYQSINMKTTNTGEVNPTTPDSESVSPDMEFWSERKTGDANEWENITMFLGKSSPINTLSKGQICPLTDASVSFNWPERHIGSYMDLDGGGDTQHNYWHSRAIITNEVPFSGDGGANVAQWKYASESEMLAGEHVDEYNTGEEQTQAFARWMASTNPNSSFAVTGEGWEVGDELSTTNFYLDLQGGSDVNVDTTNFDHFQYWKSRYSAGDHVCECNAWLGFQLAGNAMDGATPITYYWYNNVGTEDDNGLFGQSVPIQIVGKDLIVDIKITHQEGLSELRFALESHYNANTTAHGQEEFCRTWSLSIGTLVNEGATNDFVRFTLPWDTAYHEGANYRNDVINKFIIIPVYSTDPDLGDASDLTANPSSAAPVCIMKIRELTFAPAGGRTDVGWFENYFILSSSSINAKGIHSIPVDLPDSGTPGTAAGLVNRLGGRTAKLKIYKTSASGTQGNIYYQQTNEDGSPLSDKYLLAEWSYANGCRKGNSADGAWTAWQTGSSPNYVELEFDDPPTSSTYILESGYPEGTEHVDAEWKHAAVVGRTAYIGNVKQPTTGSFESSKILKSAIGKSAGFPNLQYIDVEFGGDGITHMEGIGDRLFVFASTQMVVINVAQDIEFVEASFPHLGVNEARQVCKVGEGLAIVNASGVYLFDGDQIKDIKVEKNREIVIHPTSCAIAYSALLKYLLVWGWNNDDNDVAVYSLKTDSWVGARLDTMALPTSEVVAGPNGRAYFCVNTDEYYLGAVDNDSGTDKSTILRTGKLSMGDIARNKKFYKIYINVTNPNGYTLYWSTTTTSSWTVASNSMSTGNNEIALSGASGKYIMLKLEGSSARTDFEMGELSIIYREKSIK